MSRWTVLLVSLTCVLGATAVGVSMQATQAGEPAIAQCPDAAENPLPLPSSLAPDDFHDRLLAFLQSADYATKLHWCGDKTVRDTGPYVYQEYLGTHPAVRVYYSPAIMRWLVKGRVGTLVSHPLAIGRGVVRGVTGR